VKIVSLYTNVYTIVKKNPVSILAARRSRQNRACGAFARLRKGERCRYLGASDHSNRPSSLLASFTAIAGGMYLIELPPEFFSEVCDENVARMTP
jgi:hypothetical protein